MKLCIGIKIRSVYYKTNSIVNIASLNFNGLGNFFFFVQLVELCNEQYLQYTYSVVFVNFSQL